MTYLMTYLQLQRVLKIVGKVISEIGTGSFVLLDGYYKTTYMWASYKKRHSVHDCLGVDSNLPMIDISLIISEEGRQHE